MISSCLSLILTLNQRTWFLSAVTDIKMILYAAVLLVFTMVAVMYVGGICFV